MELEVSLSPSSIAEAAKAVEQYAAALDTRLEGALSALGEAGADAARASVPVDTGTLSLSIRSERTGKLAREVTAQATDPNAHSYAAFVEFGTGVVGAAAGYPGDLSGWSYDQRQTPEAHEGDGWWYVHPDGTTRFTRGRAGSHYMADAAAAMRQRAHETVRRAFDG